MSKLFEKWNLGSLALDNRVVIAPMCQYSAINGVASSWHMMHLGQLAMSGAGLLILEATAVNPEGRISWGDLGLYDAATESALKNILDEVHKYSSMPIGIQLAHAGRKASTDKPWLGGKHISKKEKNGWETVSASNLPFSETDDLPLELDIKGLEHVKRSFIDSAQRAVRVGFKGIEVHAAHGYLMHQFLSPLSNKRSDKYGGSLQNRMRFPLEIFEAVKKSVPKDYPVWIRISATDWVEGGWSIEDSIEFCRELKKIGCEVIHVSSGGLDPKQKIPVGPNYQVKFAEQIRREVQIETIAVGLITDPENAEEIIKSGKADAIAIARAILYNPHWPWHAAAKLGAKVKAPAQYMRSQPREFHDLLIQDKIDG